MSVLLFRDGISSSGSCVKMLENCFWRIFAFSLSSNLIDFLSLMFSSSSAIPDLVFSLFRTCDQNTFGLFLQLYLFLSQNFS